MKRPSLLMIAVSLLAFGPCRDAVASAPAAAFGRPCRVENGVRFCPTRNDAQRVRSFDGQPLDVDVTLPRTGDGPFPTIILLHGYGGSKVDLEQPFLAANLRVDPFSLAAQGYAVVNYSARGFGRSCGIVVSRSSPDCDRGWLHFADQRYEVRDAQYLLGELVDEGVANPDRLGASGIGYGAVQVTTLAFLRDRIRNTDGTLAPWTSPKGTPLHLAAAWARWTTSGWEYALVPNGRLLSTSHEVDPEPYGVPKGSTLVALYLRGAMFGHYARRHADPTADFESWVGSLSTRETARRAKPFLAQWGRFHDGSQLGTHAAPLLIQNGWTDPLMTAQGAVRTYNQARASDPRAPVAVQLGDIGHFTGGDAPEQYAHFNVEGAAFLAHHLKGTRGGPRPGSAEVYRQGCPHGSLGRGPIRAPSYLALARGSFRLHLAAKQTIRSENGDSDRLSRVIDPTANPDRCARVRVETGAGRATLMRSSAGFTQLGMPVVRARVRATGRFPQLVARLWDVAGGKQRIVDFGVYRLTPGQRGEVVLQLFGNAYRFAKGHLVKLELVGRSAPLFRAGDRRFRVRVSNVRVAIPTRERPNRAAGIGKTTVLR